jgi:hypothetical protein
MFVVEWMSWLLDCDTLWSDAMGVATLCGTVDVKLDAKQRKLIQRAYRVRLSLRPGRSTDAISKR